MSSEVLAVDDIDVAIGEAATRFGRDRFAPDLRLRQPPALRRFDPARWNEMAAMGWLGLATTQEEGGLGLQVGGICALAQAAGAWGINEPLVSTCAVAADVIRLHAGREQRAQWLPRLLEGKLRVACAFAADGQGLAGVREVVPDADIADLLLVEVKVGGTSQWHAFETGDAGVHVAAYPLVDGRGAATVTLEGRPAQALPRDHAGGHSALLAALATAADSVGAMDTAFASTLEHIKTRRQFGAPLGSHQVVVHRAVDMFIRLQECRAVLAQATRALAAEGPDAAAEVHAAKAFIGPQARLLAQDAVQLHGGIGITQECRVSHCLRRAMVNEQIHGTPAEHLGQFAESANQ